MFKYLIFLLFLTFLLFTPNKINAQNYEFNEISVNKNIEAVVKEVLKESDGYQKLEMEFMVDGLSKKVTVENGNLPENFFQKYKVGDRLILISSKNQQGENVYIITDFVRRNYLLLLFTLFVGVTLIAGKFYGLTSLLGMVISFLVIFYYLLPQILEGKNPIITAILSSLIIVPITFYMSHGLSKKTMVAVLGTIISLILTGFLALIFIQLTRLTGFSSEEANFIQTIFGGVVNVKGLLLAGIIISGIGVLDDITVSQSSIVSELQNANLKLSSLSIYKKAMNVGRDHIASVVNTLVLVYTGASLPLLVLFIGNTVSFSEVINYEMIAEEILKTLVASIGLITAVPLTTFLSCFIFNKKAT